MANRFRRYGSLPYIMLIVLGMILIGLLLYVISLRYGLNASMDFTVSNEPLDNPLTGYAPKARDEEECEDSQLVYIEVLWAEWEPDMDKFDIDGLEEKWHIQRWKSEGKNAVLRFICDKPGEKEHIDIPAWLYDRTRDGAFYDSKYGKGYCPDYSNSLFRERHEVAIAALADYCNQDDFVAYVELGSLGHWGEWHTDEDGGALPMPEPEVCNDYVLDYTDHFRNARLMTRRNYAIAVEGGLGVYNDMAGHVESTQMWLGWLRDGGTQKTAGDPLQLLPVERFWDIAPVGGELTSSVDVEDLLGRWLEDTVETVESAHMTFIGPACPSGALKDSEAAQKLRERLGYRLYISHLETAYAFGRNELDVRMTWSNAGLAPLYWEWPVMMYVYDSSGQPIYWESVDIDLRQVTPGEKVETLSHIPFADVFRQGFQIGIGIESPDMTKKIMLAMEGEVRDGAKVIYTFAVD